MIVQIIIGVILWMLTGFCAFLIDARRDGRSEFDYGAKVDLIGYTCFGLFSLAVVTCYVFLDKFDSFMSDLLKKNAKK